MMDFFKRIVFWRKHRSLEDIGLSEAKIRQIACHEAGHVLVAHLCGDGEAIIYASIAPEKSEGGYGIVRNTPDPHFMKTSTRSELESVIAKFLGGRAAEEVAFGKEKISVGCSADLAAATTIATNMVAFWGFSEKLGLVSIDIKTAADMPEVRAEAARILDTQYARALDLIRENRHALDELTSGLVECRLLTAEDIRKILARTTSL